MSIIAKATPITATPLPVGPSLARPAPPRIHIRDLTVRYTPDTPVVLDGIDLDLHAGETVALLGSSGSGKSTLMKSLTGFAPITSGTVHVGEVDVARVRPRQLRALRAEVGQVFQQFNLIGRLSVLTNVLAGSLHRAGPLNALGTFRGADRRRALELLDRVGIAHKASDAARTLSGGQQQRVAIARALMQDPTVILADEPVASLDPRMSRVVLDLLRSISRDEGIPVLVSLHVLPLAMDHSDRVVGLRDGRVVVEGRTADLDAEGLATVYENDDEEVED
ncbi:phosphonate ABC transporter ATP-binding protein [Actinotalea sp. BY-33]|uniref:Phosphonate ABC transporter ATP-binding protein n=1 Tax=Actinotalea soli TaxID=2819234 RepID=A0A939RTM5_9CELL|nr:phosphonate ABC transporter ATP-binding protein [Actinotalea soli]MBO1751449.1 phosphonate ABC transporter ATP-binding protein [Actinotalea soli]